MEMYEIKYKYNGKTYTVVESPTKGFENQFYAKVLARIESFVMAGATIIDLIYSKK